MIDEEYKETIIGTPQGGNLSPLLSNIMLNELDKELGERGLNFVRYADDVLIVTKSEKVANRVMKSVTKFLEEKLGLKVNPTKSKIDRPQSVVYKCATRIEKKRERCASSLTIKEEFIQEKLNELTCQGNGYDIEQIREKVESIMIFKDRIEINMFDGIKMNINLQD